MTDYVGRALGEQAVEAREPAFKSCGCGARYSAETWAALEVLGFQHFEQDGIAPEQTIEIRNCSRCNSSLAVEVAK